LQPVEYVTWVMDDHLVRWREGKWCYPPNIEVLFARHLKHARVVFVISPVMADFYRERFGVESRVLFGPADVPAGPAPEPQPHSNDLRLAYFGAVTEWQLDALELVAQNCTAAGAMLDIYSGLAQLPDGLRHSCVRLMGRIPAAEVGKTMRRYDAVVLPISFLPELRQMSELNIATKMSECLANGIPTLAVGPPYAAMVRFLEQHAAALCVTEPAAEAVGKALVSLRDVGRRRSLVEAARELVVQQLSTEAMRRVWTQGLAELGSVG
jgi:glycosyltransferase involved in cell wall biosynthesis